VIWCCAKGSDCRGKEARRVSGERAKEKEREGVRKEKKEREREREEFQKEKWSRRVITNEGIKKDRTRSAGKQKKKRKELVTGLWQ